MADSGFKGGFSAYTMVPNPKNKKIACVVGEPEVGRRRGGRRKRGGDGGAAMRL